MHDLPGTEPAHGAPVNAPRPSGAWRLGDPTGERKFVTLGQLQPELGGHVLPEVQVAYETWGQPRTDSAGSIVNAVLVEHALTGDSHVSGAAGVGHVTAGWWDALVGPGRALDTDQWFVICANVLGGCQGTTGPSSPSSDGRAWGSRFPRITVRDQVEVERRLLERIGVQSLAAVIGGSMGGMRALEWLATHGHLVHTGLLLATGAAASADQIGTQTAQIMAIQSDPAWRGGDYHDGPGRGPDAGLGLARRIAHLTYRSDTELDVRFGREAQDGESPFHAEGLAAGYRGSRFAVQSYLDHHAQKIARRFDPGSYVSLTDAMTTHDVGRDRGGVAAALSAVSAPVIVAGLDSDRLYPLRLQQELAALLPGCAEARVIRSPYGHDGFLLEADQVAPLVVETLELARDSMFS
jgi:homoserine O-acetyltransferase/O-succinyltransferase